MVPWQNSRDAPGEHARLSEGEVNGALSKNRYWQKNEENENEYRQRE
jgi:hypothetical protein